MYVSPVTEEEISKALCKLRTKKSCGPDGLHPRFIRDVGSFIVTPLVHIINRSFQTGIVPSKIKVAKVKPLFKGGEKDLATNYRPISMLSVITKIMEGAMYKRVQSYLEKYKILSPDQYGFRCKRSTKGALIRFVHTVQQNLDNGKKSAAVYIDLKKAFDTVNHNILLEKIEIYGIRGPVLNWFKDYLKNRKQYIENQTAKSEEEILPCGVPQGSNLGPLLFLLYINDLPLSVKTGQCTLFADDTTIYNVGNTYHELVTKINLDLKELNKWFISNKLTLNIKKTNACVFGNQTAECKQLALNDMKIDFSESVKYLGVYVDKKLKWNEHIRYVTKKINQILGILSKARNSINERMSLAIYHSLINSRLTYCQEVWATACKTTLKSLEVAQKKAIRIIAKVGRREHTEDLFKKFKVRMLSQDIQFKRSLLALEIIKNPELHDVKLKITSQHRYNTRFTSSSIPIPRKKTWVWGTRGIEFLLVQAYNSLPEEIKNLPSTNKRGYQEKVTISFFCLKDYLNQTIVS